MVKDKMSGGKSIKVEAAGSLRQYVVPGATVYNVHTVGEAISQLNLPETGELLMLVNGRIAYSPTLRGLFHAFTG
jgi:hypothetical protein